MTDFTVQEPSATSVPQQRSPADDHQEAPEIRPPEARPSETRPPEPRRPGRPRPVPLPPAGAVAVAMLAAMAALGIWFVLYAVFFSGLQEDHTQHVLYSQLRYELAQATVPLGGTIAPRTPIAYVQAPTIGLDQVIVEGTSSEDLASGPGHLPTSPLPGQAGNSQIYGRSVMFGAPFRNVHNLKAGAPIIVTTGQGKFVFRVLDVRGPGDPVPSAKQAGQASMTLITSAGTGWRTGWAPNHAIYADATLVGGKVQQAPNGRPTVALAIDKPMAGDTGVLFALVLWLEALVAICAGLAWAYTRWTGWQLWVIGLPSVLALLWVTTSYAVLLLPNLA